MDALRSISLHVFLYLAIVACPQIVFGNKPDEATRDLLSRFCVDCHNKQESEAGVNFEALFTENDSFASRFRLWDKAATQLEQKRMPPAEANQPSPDQRRKLSSSIRAGISAAASKHKGDPGHVIIRRLTSAEYGYAIEDLTGLDINVETGFVQDSVGGAGFTNTGLVQFTEEATLERFLESARSVADHAVVGTGPLLFFRAPGQTGFELSAIDRIQKIYREHGFRTAAGEGGESFGLDRYALAFFSAWQYQNRTVAGEPDFTFADCARSVQLDARFVEYIHSVVTRENASFPTSEIVNAWQKLPSARKEFGRQDIADVARRCQKISELLFDWQNRFGSNTDAKEEAPVLRADLFDVKQTQPFEMNVNWPKGTKTAHLVLSVESANRNGRPDAVIKWKDAKIQFRDYAKVLQDPRPLRDHLSEETVARLGFGKHPRGGQSGRDSFVTVGTKPPSFELPIPDGAGSARLFVTAELDIEHGEDSIVRCTISQLEETDQGKSVSGLLASPNGEVFEKWKAGVLEFARLLPQMSQREPAPSDRDPIPDPIDPTYNNAERNFFHTRIKYFRDDRFLVENILDDATRRKLDEAWADLLGSFDFHDAWLQLLSRKFDFDPGERRIADIDDTWIASTPVEAQGYLRTLKADFDRIRSRLRNAESRHLSDVVELAGQAWRRPLSAKEEAELFTFYQRLRSKSKLDHRSAVAALVARVLVSPSFLYRAERASGLDAEGSPSGKQKAVKLTSSEIASRLSFLLWSSVPDAELHHSARRDLNFKQPLQYQVRRMLRDPRSRRFTVEFFGQWFGFYRFDQFAGIDRERFPEFTKSLRSQMYGEAVEFFDFVVRENRPVQEILDAKYSFLTNDLASHYGIEASLKSASQFERVEDRRGGLLRLGVVLATTSAPRRTSPVKRGDWILRRVLGTAVPPPPADAGSIAADEVVASGLSIRQRLEAHRRDVSCHNCHSRFDAFGFALENYDPLGRFRETYRDGKAVETAGALRDGTELTGDKELLDYLRRHQSRFYQTLAERLLGYALGRRVLVGDLQLIDQLKDDMKNGSGISALLERIVTSRQFRYHQ